eukprot:7024094-Pyramimonas_sp.AAC.1
MLTSARAAKCGGDGFSPRKDSGAGGGPGRRRKERRAGLEDAGQLLRDPAAVLDDSLRRLVKLRQRPRLLPAPLKHRVAAPSAPSLDLQRAPLLRQQVVRGAAVPRAAGGDTHGRQPQRLGRPLELHRQVAGREGPDPLAGRMAPLLQLEQARAEEAEVVEDDALLPRAHLRRPLELRGPEEEAPVSRLGARRSHGRRQLQRRQRIAPARAEEPVEGQGHRQRVLDPAAREE